MSPELDCLSEEIETPPQSTFFGIADQYAPIFSAGAACTNQTFSFAVPQHIPPEQVLLDVELAFERGVVHMRVIDLNISVEAETLQEAFRSLVENVAEWLETFKGDMDFAAESEPQLSYAELLGYPPMTWFRFISSDQAYFWSREWQQGEQEALEELRRGEALTFDDPEEALRWLNGPNEE